MTRSYLTPSAGHRSATQSPNVPIHGASGPIRFLPQIGSGRRIEPRMWWTGQLHHVRESADLALLGSRPITPEILPRLSGHVMSMSVGMRCASGQGTVLGDVPISQYEGVSILLSLIHISEPTRRTPISYAVF